MPLYSRYRLLSFFLLLILTSANLFADSYYIQGKKAFASRNYEKAHKLFRDAIRTSPSNGDPYFYIGYMLEYEEKRDEAVEAYRQGVALRMDRELREKALWKIILHYKHTRNWTGLIYYSEKFLAHRDDPEVQKLLETARQNQDPRIPEIQSLLKSATGKEQVGDFEGAKSDYNKALDLDQELESAHWRIALLYIRENQNKKAANHLYRLVQLFPDSWEYHYKYSLVLYRLAQFEDSRTQLELSEKTNNAPGSTFKFYTALLGGLLSIEQEKPQEAIRELSPFQKNQNALVYGSLARARLATGDDQKAMELIRLALQKDPNQTEALMADYLISLPVKNRNESIIRFRRFRDSLAGSFEGDREIPFSYKQSILSGATLLLTEDPESAEGIFKIQSSTLDQLASAPFPEKDRAKPYEVDFFQFPPSRENVAFAFINFYKRNQNTNQARGILNRLSDSPWKDYEMALLSALEKQPYGARYALMKLFTSYPEMKNQARKEQAFIDLGNADESFRTFLFQDESAQPALETPATTAENTASPAPASTTPANNTENDENQPGKTSEQNPTTSTPEDSDRTNKESENAR